MNKKQQREAMDAECGPGAYDRMTELVKAEEREVAALGHRIGFGRLMQAASKVWKSIEPLIAWAPGPPFSQCVICPCLEKNKSPGHCEWCVGTGIVTARVATAMRLDEMIQFIDKSTMTLNRRADLVLAMRVAPSLTITEAIRMVHRQHTGK